MATPYDYPVQEEEKPPRFTIMSLIAVAFAVFMVWQVADTIGQTETRYDVGTVQEGDTVQYHYVARLPDGTLWETSRLEVAEAANQTGSYVLQPAPSYQPKTAQIDPNDPGLPWGAAADQTVLGKRIGQTITISVPAANGTGEWQPFIPDQPGIPREIHQRPFQRLVFFQEAQHAEREGNDHARDINLTQLDRSLGGIHEGYVFNSGERFPPTWDIHFEELNWDNGSLLVRHMVEDGQTLETPDLPGDVTLLLRDDDTRVVYRLNLEEGATFIVPPQSELDRFGFSPGSYLVESQTDEHIALLYHPSLDPEAIGQPLEVEITLLGKPNQEGQ